MIRIEIDRLKLGKTACLGELRLFVDDALAFTCKTLEEEIESDQRGQDHRIPEGDYQCKWHFGSRFTKRLSDICGFECPPLHLYNDQVPADRYILIHGGNTAKDTEGCILLGSEWGGDGESITASRNAIQVFYQTINRRDCRDIMVSIKNKF